jgi:hypothetical protein
MPVFLEHPRRLRMAVAAARCAGALAIASAEAAAPNRVIRAVVAGSIFAVRVAMQFQ